MKIVQAFDQTVPIISGYTMRSRYISESLQKLGVEVTAVRSPAFSYDNSVETIDGVSYVSTNWPHPAFAKLPVLRELALVRGLRNGLNKEAAKGVDLVDAHSSLLMGMAAAATAKKFNKPFLYEIRALWEDARADQGRVKEASFMYKLIRYLETRVINKADHVTVICEGLKNDLVGRGIDQDKITVIPNGVDTDKFSPVARDPAITEKYQLEDSPVIGFIGTFFEFEGLDLLIEAARGIVKNNPRTKFLLVGAGRHDDYLKSLVNEYKLQENVIFTGRVPHDDILKYYAAIDVLVYPRISKRITELVTPLKPLEAMAMKRVVIGSDVGGIKELVADQENGLLFKAHDVNDLIEKCEYAINNLEQLQPMVERARVYVEQQRQWPVICEKYLDIFKQMGIN